MLTNKTPSKTNLQQNLLKKLKHPGITHHLEQIAEFLSLKRLKNNLKFQIKRREVN